MGLNFRSRATHISATVWVLPSYFLVYICVFSVKCVKCEHLVGRNNLPMVGHLAGRELNSYRSDRRVKGLKPPCRAYVDDIGRMVYFFSFYIVSVRT